MVSKSDIHKNNFKSVFYPKSIAIIGANNVEGTVPYDIVKSILISNYKGIIYPVSPKETSILNIKAYKYVIDIELPVDLAIVVFPSSVCNLVLEQLGQKGIKAAIIISAGFKEVGSVGLEREKQIKEIADKYGISFIGPNCLGVINTDPKVNLNASFARKMPSEGNIGFLSQSGALCTAVLDYAQSKNIGFSKFVSFGNKADISEIDLLYYLADDPKTKVILLYLEEISDGKALMDCAKDIISKTGKPILAIKAGRTNEGAAAAASHTGSLAGSDEICNAAFEQAGIIRCNDILEMFDTAIAFAYQPIPKNNRVSIITNAGGPGVLTTDALIKDGLKLAKFSEETTAIFSKVLPKTANIKNPVDVIGDAKADRYNLVVTESLKDDNVDAVFVILTPQSMTEIEIIAQEIVDVSKNNSKPIYTSFMGATDVAAGIRILEKNNIPNYTLPESMSKSFTSVFNFGQNLNRNGAVYNLDKTQNNVEMAKSILSEALEEKKSYLTEDKTNQLLSCYNLPVLESFVASSAEEAVSFAEKIGFPIVLKIVSDDIVHKFDVNGIVLDIQSREEVIQGYSSIIENVMQLAPEAKIKGILVRKMIPKGEEVILGIKRDNSFGPVIMYGLGGVFVEVFRDVSFRVAPLSLHDIKSMILNTKSSKLLFGARGKNLRDVESLYYCLSKLSELAIDLPQIKELDINPLILLDINKGCYIADAKIML
ncbi:MAG: acetate--CoA ligase family protein [Bacteroidetes bacterium]|nr:acetate--CoA ligase family protein [Bacteroidota bacterium]